MWKCITMWSSAGNSVSISCTRELNFALDSLEKFCWRNFRNFETIFRRATLSREIFLSFKFAPTDYLTLFHLLEQKFNVINVINI